MSEKPKKTLPPRPDTTEERQAKQQNSQATQRKVQISLELPSKFVGLLNTKAMLTGLLDKDELDAGEVIMMLVLMEARGATPEQIHAKTPMMWRDQYGPIVLHEQRRVIDEAALAIPADDLNEVVHELGNEQEHVCDFRIPEAPANKPWYLICETCEKTRDMTEEEVMQYKIFWRTGKWPGEITIDKTPPKEESADE